MQGYNQEEGIDYHETFALVARIEAIRMLMHLHHTWASSCIKLMRKVLF